MLDGVGAFFLSVRAERSEALQKYFPNFPCRDVPLQFFQECRFKAFQLVGCASCSICIHVKRRTALQEYVRFFIGKEFAPYCQWNNCNLFASFNALPYNPLHASVVAERALAPCREFSLRKEDNEAVALKQRGGVIKRLGDAFGRLLVDRERTNEAEEPKFA